MLVVTHGAAGASLVETAERVTGPLAPIGAVGVGPAEEPTAFQHRIEEQVRRLGTDEVLFLVDLAGSTPANLCQRFCGHGGVLVTGVNLAMLFKLATADRSHGARALAEELLRTGLKSIGIIDAADRS